MEDHIAEFRIKGCLPLNPHYRCGAGNNSPQVVYPDCNFPSNSLVSVPLCFSGTLRHQRLPKRLTYLVSAHRHIPHKSGGLAVARYFRQYSQTDTVFELPEWIW